MMNAHNSSHLIGRPLRSVLEQTFESWELIIWDNASSDDLQTVLAEFPDDRVKYFFDPRPESLYYSRVKAIRQASSEFIAFLDHDDVWLPDKLASQLPLFDDPSVVVACSDYWTCRLGSSTGITRTLTRTYSEDRVPLESVLMDYRIALSTVVARTSVLVANLPARPPDYYIVEDLDLVCRTLRGGTLGVLHSPVTEYWVHDTNLSSDQQLVVQELEHWLESWVTEMGQVNPVPEWVYRRAYELAVVRARASLAAGARKKGVTQLPAQMPIRKKLKYLIAAALMSRQRLRATFSAR